MARSQRFGAPACGCKNHTRSELLRQAAALPGRGLPAIEPGMPLPAGTGLDRRAFLLRSAGLALSVYGASALSGRAFEEGIAQAAAGAPNDKVLVSVFMEGGADGMSILCPVGHPQYATLRPTLALPAGQGTAFSEDNTLHWHPDAASVAALHTAGKVSVAPAIAYDHPDQSQFTSRHYWEVGELDINARFGWMGRYLDQYGVPDNPLQGLSLDYSLAPALASANVPVSAVAQPKYASDWYTPGVYGPVLDAALDEFGKLGRLPGGDAALKTARRAADYTAKVREELVNFDFTPPAGANYPADSYFGDQLAALAAMLAKPLPLKCVALVAPGGYDTHSDQAASMPANVQETCDALAAFQRDLAARGLEDRVLTHVWSEFGRRPEENGSGTDHGAAGLSFVIGSQAKGTMVGSFPGLATLDEDDNLRGTSDFRAVYCALLAQWFGADPAAIIPDAGQFSTLPTLVR
jgi:uncharacterized protein (DUF1501 family)